ncbi:hypothetical protein D3C84_406920 [compost metagenome]
MFRLFFEYISLQVQFVTQPFGAVLVSKIDIEQGRHLHGDPGIDPDAGHVLWHGEQGLLDPGAGHLPGNHPELDVLRRGGWHPEPGVPD